MLIKVTQEDIDRGTHGGVESCPVALAIKRQQRKRTRVASYGFRILVDKTTGTWRVYNNPSIAQDWIKDFDNHQNVKPFQFEAELDRIMIDLLVK